MGFKPKEFMQVMKDILAELRGCRAELNAIRMAIETQCPPFTYTCNVPTDDPWPKHPDMVDITWTGDTREDEP